MFYQDEDGILAVNRLYCASTNPITTEDLTEITEALFDVWVAQIMPMVTPNWSLTGITARDMSEAEGLEHIDTNAYPVAGTQDSAFATPNQVSYTVTLNTGLVGRSARGRVYGVGLGTDYIDGQRLTDPAQATVQSAWFLVMDAMETAGHALQVVSFETGGVPRAEGRPLPVVSVNARFPLATQRRRLT